MTGGVTSSPEAAELPAGVCVCGRDIPEASPSDWACGELCQSAWLMHQADPDYPHPRQIREGAEARAAAIRRDQGSPFGPVRAADSGVVVPQGTEIDVDGTRFVRVGTGWQQTGPWTLLRGELADALEYRRWCPHCQVRRGYRLVEFGPDRTWQGQTCAECRHVWPGRALFGLVESRGEPWPAIRLRLTDGVRSTTHTVPAATLERITATAAAWSARPAEVLAAFWIKLERGLSDTGRADQDTGRRTRRMLWDWLTVTPEQARLMSGRLDVAGGGLDVVS